MTPSSKPPAPDAIPGKIRYRKPKGKPRERPLNRIAAGAPPRGDTQPSEPRNPKLAKPQS